MDRTRQIFKDMVKAIYGPVCGNDKSALENIIRTTSDEDIMNAAIARIRRIDEAYDNLVKHHNEKCSCADIW